MELDGKQKNALFFLLRLLKERARLNLNGEEAMLFSDSYNSLAELFKQPEANEEKQD